MTDVIRVGFPFAPTGSWMGGINYLGNLFLAIKATPACGLHPILVTSAAFRDRLPTTWPEIEVHVASCLNRRTLPWLVRGALRKATGTDLSLQAALLGQRVDIVSHGLLLGRRPRLPTIAWLPDMQHCHFPEFFPGVEWQRRDREYRDTCRYAGIIIASSHAAGRDLETHLRESRGKVRVLHFVDSMSRGVASTPIEDLLKKYRLASRYILLPNQFWKHKNHGVVIEALGILKQADRHIQVVCTGGTDDFRNPAYFPMLMKRVEDLRVQDMFRVLGLVPYADLAGLMRGAAALLNPSLFEGWSTSVEESKSLGKRIVLSDIDVHLEQNPARGRFFKATDPAALAAALWETWTTYNPDEEAEAATLAETDLLARREVFALAYADIVRDLLPLRSIAAVG